jgi:hypothetical protein
MGDAHALAAAAGGSLDHDRIADLVRDPSRLLFVFDHAEIARHRRDLGGGRGALALDLVAHGGDGFRVRPDKHDTRLGKGLRKSRALRQKAVSRMDGFCAGLQAGCHDLVDQQVTLSRGRWTDRNRRVGHLDVEGVAVGVRINGNRRNPHPTGGLDDPAGDLAAVGNEDSLEHCGLILANRHQKPLRRQRENVNDHSRLASGAETATTTAAGRIEQSRGRAVAFTKRQCFAARHRQ